MHNLMTGETRYFGIWIQKENTYFWICDANGGEEFCGEFAPTEERITNYRNRVVKG